ncbi:hypothetical protein Ahy_A08g038829 [Arachis hypogaea]|uniref:Uncharacterized protein n=1 Tax=Arachis hypogaea TaxID=3818 RepID=A0A445BUW0_ARAHY|nr:hypothetical protein Ahy_A08g038829 [Arachis hypogaea]
MLKRSLVMIGKKISQRNISARRKASIENQTNTNGATGFGSKYAGPNKSRAADAARPNTRTPNNAGQKVHGSTSSSPTANGPKTVRTRAGLPNSGAASAADLTNSSVSRHVKRRRKESSETEVSKTDSNKVKKTFWVTCSKCGENVVDHPNPTQSAANAPGSVSSMVSKIGCKDL